MEFRLLGPVGAWQSGEALSVGGRRERTVLTALLLADGTVVPVHQLIDAVWGERPPVTARRQVHSAVSVLRRVLGERLVTTEPGYQLVVKPGEFDLAEFESLVARSRAAAAAGETASAADTLRAALRLWRGPALCGVAGFAGEAARLSQRRLAVLAERVELDLALGRHADLVSELAGLVADQPHVEQFRAQLMLALYRCGRRAEALEAFRDARRTLAEDLGLEPRGELCRLERAMLAGETWLDLPGSPAGAALAAASAALPRAPCLLPADIADFVGREEHVDALCEALSADDRPAAPWAVTGRGGIGKTAVVLHVAHRLRSEFADGRLFVDLRGTEPVPARPAEVLARFLRAMGTDGSAIPDGLDERAELYRQRLAGRRVLVVLDNAHDESQVTALMPGSPTCRVLVTSRTVLGALAGARTVELATLEPEQGVRLLGRIVGPHRVRAEPREAAELVRLCAGLPLAVRITGAKLAARPHWRLADLVFRLADERQRLDELAYGGLAVRASLEPSYQRLDREAQRLFRRLGLLDSPEFGACTCAAILDSSLAVAEELVERLVEVRLLQVVGRRRYRIHELVRAYAKEQLSCAADVDADADDAAAERVAAIPRCPEPVARDHLAPRAFEYAPSVR